jgi:hypothetical protein
VSKNGEIYVGDLKKYLAHHRVSPEIFAKNTQLSHMTIRRWLKKSNSESIPSKYIPTLGPLFGKSRPPELPKLSLARALENESMSSLMITVEKSGRRFKDLQRLEMAVEQRLKNSVPDKTIERCCDELLKAAKSTKTSDRVKGLAKGALLYFTDLRRLPDDTPLIGYLGELAVLSVALNTIYSTDL